MPTISALSKPDPTKAHQLYKAMAKGTPSDARKAAKLNPTLTKQFLFISQGATGPTVKVLSYPMFTTDKDNQTLLIGSYGNDADNLAPIAIPGVLLGQSTSTLLPKNTTTKYDFPVLPEDPLDLEAPDEATNQDRFHYHFTDPAMAPVIAGIPALFPVPVGITPPTDWVLDIANEIPEDVFNCEAGRTWVTAMSRVCTHQDGKPIHLDATIFKLDELTLDPFTTFEMAPTVMTEYRMLNPSEE